MLYDDNVEKRIDDLVDEAKKNENMYSLLAAVEKSDEDDIEVIEFSNEEAEAAADFYWENEWRKDITWVFVLDKILEQEGTI